MRSVRWLLTLALFSSLFCAATSRASASTVYIRSGPDGEIQISTPWGDYAAYDEGGGVYWVGTQKEFDRMRVVGIMQGHGARLSIVNEPGATATFVEAGSYRTFVGPIALDEIVPKIEFSGEVTGPDAKNFRQVSVLWIQRSSTVITCAFYNPKTHQSLGSNETQDANEEWRSMVFAMPKTWLTQPVVMVFFAKGYKPGVIPLPSMTRADYQYQKQRAASFQSEGMSTKDELAQIARLERIDPSLTRTPHAVRPKPTPAPPVAPSVTPSVAPSYDTVATTATTDQTQNANSRMNLLAPAGVSLALEIADTEQKREAGLSGRASVPVHHGMLFVFDGDAQRMFWMKGVPYPLDFVFVSGDGRITSVRTIAGVPMGTPDNRIPQFGGNGRFVIAMPAGEADADGFQTGIVLYGLPKAP